MKAAIQLTLLTAGALLALTACNLPGSPNWDLDTSDTGAPNDIPVDPVISQVSMSCSADVWTFDSRLDGLAGLATLDIFETGDGNWPGNVGAVWSESHNMRNTDWDPAGQWDEWGLSLRHVTSINQQIASSTTLFGCAWNDGNSLAFRETIYDDSQRKLDCVIWGEESQQYFNGYLGDSCICVDIDGSCTN